MVALVLAAGLTAADVRVGASAPALPCAAAAARAYSHVGGRSVRVAEEDARAGTSDAFVGVAFEVTRLVEAGLADPRTETALARIPWVLSGAPPPAGGLQALAGREVALPSARWSFEAARAVERVAGAQARSESDADTLRRAPLALLPLSMAPLTDVAPVDIPPLSIAGAVRRSATLPVEAAAFLNYLATQRGQSVFTECGR